MGPSPGHLPDPRIETGSLKSPALAGEFFTTHATWEAHLPANLRGFSKSCLLTFWSGFRSAVLLFSHKRELIHLKTVSFWEKGTEIYFPLMCPCKGKMT